VILLTTVDVKLPPHSVVVRNKAHALRLSRTRVGYIAAAKPSIIIIRDFQTTVFYPHLTTTQQLTTRIQTSTNVDLKVESSALASEARNSTLTRIFQAHLCQLASIPQLTSPAN
jgi:hypothetical protein